METYEAPKMEIIEFEVEDVITTSTEDPENTIPFPRT